MRWSLEGRLALAGGAVLLAAVLGAALLGRLSGSWWLAVIVVLAVAMPLLVWAMHLVLAPVNRLFRALADGVSSLRDDDYSISIATDRRDELGELVAAYNRLTEVLRAERQTLMQRELLLDTVVQTTPLAIVLTDAGGNVVYTNTAARELFAGGGRFEGKRFAEVLAEAPAALRGAVQRGLDGLFATGEEGSQETWHVSCRTFSLNARPHELYLFKQLTRELSRQEVLTWKKVIRVIAHELNNSLAPISSLASSGRVVAAAPQPDRDKLDVIFTTVADRARHLKVFIDGYARFAKLPQPRCEAVEWGGFVRALQETVPFDVRGGLPTQPGWFDPMQMEQVLINLLKNARESGSPAESVELAVVASSGGLRIRVLDRGGGMSENVLRNALLPFYSTKRSGTGLGLPLCREIVEAHGGRMNLANRQGGGVAIDVWLPGRRDEAAAASGPAD